jgi:hypothetical protein
MQIKRSRIIGDFYGSEDIPSQPAQGLEELLEGLLSSSHELV